MADQWDKQGWELLNEFITRHSNGDIEDAAFLSHALRDAYSQGKEDAAQIADAHSDWHTQHDIAHAIRVS